VSTKDEQKREGLFSACPKWGEHLFIAWAILLIASPFVGLTNRILYMMFLREHDVGLFDTPGWDLYWEYHLNGLGCALFMFQYAPWVLALLAIGGVLLWMRLFDRA